MNKNTDPRSFPDFATIKDLPPKVSAAHVELAYRRGFSQGVASVMYGLQEGYDFKDVEKYCERVYKWRLRLTWKDENHPKITFPEWLSHGTLVDGAQA